MDPWDGRPTELTGTEPRRRRRRAFPGTALFTLALAGTLGASALVRPGSWPPPALRTPGPTTSALPAVTPTPTPTPAPAPTDRPTAGAGAADAPLGAPPPPPAGGGAHTFAVVQEDGSTPVAYDPCRPLHYVVRPEHAPPGGEDLLRGAVDRLSRVTGLQFRYEGPTDEPASDERPSFQPARYGDRWAPVLITWNTVEENPALDGEVVGVAGSAWRSLGDGPRVYVSGAVSLDGPQLTAMLERRDGRAQAEAVILHELAHLVGLGHVDDPAQLLYPRAQLGVTDFGPGDLTGLARLGEGPCEPAL